MAYLKKIMMAGKAEHWLKSVQYSHIGEPLPGTIIWNGLFDNAYDIPFKDAVKIKESFEGCSLDSFEVIKSKPNEQSDGRN